MLSAKQCISSADENRNFFQFTSLRGHGLLDSRLVKSSVKSIMVRMTHNITLWSVVSTDYGSMVNIIVLDFERIFDEKS